MRGSSSRRARRAAAIRAPTMAWCSGGSRRTASSIAASVSRSPSAKAAESHAWRGRPERSWRSSSCALSVSANTPGYRSPNATSLGMRDRAAPISHPWCSAKALSRSRAIGFQTCEPSA